MGTTAVFCDVLVRMKPAGVDANAWMTLCTELKPLMDALELTNNCPTRTTARDAFDECTLGIMPDDPARNKLRTFYYDHMLDVYYQKGTSGRKKAKIDRAELAGLDRLAEMHLKDAIVYETRDTKRKPMDEILREHRIAAAGGSSRVGSEEAQLVDRAAGGSSGSEVNKPKKMDTSRVVVFDDPFADD